MNPQKIAQTKQTLDTLAVVIRELPLREYLSQMAPDDSARKTVEAILGVQATLPSISPEVHR